MACLTHRKVPSLGRAPLFTLVFLAITACIPRTAVLADEGELDPDAITIGVIGDQTFSADIQATYQVLEQAVNLLSGFDLDVVLHVGDLVESSRPPQEVRALFDQATAILDQLPVEWFLTAGDHDVNPPVFQQDSSDRSREELFQELYGQRVPAFQQHPFYSFDVGKFHFIALYSHTVLHADPRFGNIFLARIFDEQLDWLAQDLQATKAAGEAKAIVVFLHQPLWYHWSGWRRVHELLREFPVAVVITGHHHYDQDNGALDGVRYLTVGATGGVTKQGSPDAGDVDHVTVVRVDEEARVAVELFEVPSGAPLALTPREDMDRIQALDVQLGNLFNFASVNPVLIKDGELVGSCESPQPATIRITQLGNPIDLPMRFRIDFSSDSSAVGLSSPSFPSGDCIEAVSDFECIVRRTARTFFSNYSSVLINEQFAPPLWQADVEKTGTEPPPPGTVLRFDILTGFAVDSDELFLTRTVTTTVAACP
jgi:hypothetical protein